MKIAAVPLPEPKYAVWIGGIILAFLATFLQMVIILEEDNEAGRGIIALRCFQTTLGSSLLDLPEERKSEPDFFLSLIDYGCDPQVELLVSSRKCRKLDSRSTEDELSSQRLRRGRISKAGGQEGIVRQIAHRSRMIFVQRTVKSIGKCLKKCVQRR
jgi:hypothetical protein